MGLFSKEKEEPMPYQSANEANPPPPYGSQQPFIQNYPPQQQYDQQQQTLPPPGFTDAPYQPQPQPQYHQRAPSPSGLSKGPNPIYTTTTTPRSFPTPQPRILQLTREGLSQRKAHLYEADGKTPAYEIKSSYSAEWSSSKPQIEITSAYTGQKMGSINFHSMSRRIDLVINGRTVPLEYNGWSDRSYRFMSSVGPLKWAATSTMGAGLACTTERNEWLAKFDTSWFSMRGKGTLEIVNGGLPPGLVDELVVSGLAMVENDRRNAAAATSGGAAAGAGAGAAC